VAYKRTTKDVVCRKCGHKNRVPIDARLAGGPVTVCCARRLDDGFRCCGSYKLDKKALVKQCTH